MGRMGRMGWAVKQSSNHVALQGCPGGAMRGPKGLRYEHPPINYSQALLSLTLKSTFSNRSDRESQHSSLKSAIRNPQSAIRNLKSEI
jgi:hypothetical protein